METAAINKSLSALGDVMTAIAAKDAHVPFRNSKLTFLLQPSLSRGARVMFIVTASPDAIDAPETLISLGFGTRARTAQLGREQRAGAAPGGATPQPVQRVASHTPGRVGATTPGRAGATTPGRVAPNSTPRHPAGKTPDASPRPMGGGPSIVGTKRPVTPGGAANSAKRPGAPLAAVN